MALRWRWHAGRVAGTWALAWAGACSASAQTVTPANGIARVQSAGEALAQDGAALAQLIGIDQQEAERRLTLQEASVAATDGLALRWRDRLAGLSVEQQPDFHIAVLLTGTEPVADEVLAVAGDRLPVRYRVGAAATRDQLLSALATRRDAIRAAMAHPVGLGLDGRAGTLVVVAQPADVDAEGATVIEQRLSATAGVPVRLRVVDRPGLDMIRAADVEGGARVTGISPADGRRYACTTGFTVTDGLRDGVVTAAHCPDQLSYLDPQTGTEVPLPMVGQWGWGYQDVQVNAAASPVAPLFYADTAKVLVRPVTGQRSRTQTRAGDIVCHRGERTGYSCAPVELTDFSPAGDLCGGECAATWVTVAGPTCKGGDSGAPVFIGTVAFGIVKGGTYRADGSCAFYFFMSTDYLPNGWALMTDPAWAGAADGATGNLQAMSKN